MPRAIHSILPLIHFSSPLSEHKQERERENTREVKGVCLCMLAYSSRRLPIFQLIASLVCRGFPVGFWRTSLILSPPLALPFLRVVYVHRKDGDIPRRRRRRFSLSSLLRYYCSLHLDNVSACQKKNARFVAISLWTPTCYCCCCYRATMIRLGRIPHSLTKQIPSTIMAYREFNWHRPRNRILPFIFFPPSRLNTFNECLFV